jgi:hypothetical protein
MIYLLVFLLSLALRPSPSQAACSQYTYLGTQIGVGTISQCSYIDNTADSSATGPLYLVLDDAGVLRLQATMANTPPLESDVSFKTPIYPNANNPTLTLDTTGLVTIRNSGGQTVWMSVPFNLMYPGRPTDTFWAIVIQGSSMQVQYNGAPFYASNAGVVYATAGIGVNQYTQDTVTPSYLINQLDGLTCVYPGFYPSTAGQPQCSPS